MGLGEGLLLDKRLASSQLPLSEDLGSDFVDLPSESESQPRRVGLLSGGLW